jgi:hypothetical protein
MNASGQHNLRCLDIAATNRKRKKPNRPESARLHRKA